MNIDKDFLIEAIQQSTDSEMEALLEAINDVGACSGIDAGYALITIMHAWWDHLAKQEKEAFLDGELSDAERDEEFRRTDTKQRVEGMK